MRAFDPFDSEGVRRGLLSFLRRQVGASIEIGALRRYTVGFSWVTYGLSAQWTEAGEPVARDLILRVGPPNGIFAPYRAEPEFLALRSLSGSGVPAPRPYWRCEDDDVLGAPFFVCELVKGDAPIPWTPDGGPAFDEISRVNLGGQFVAALAALHNLDWRNTPAAGLDGAAESGAAAAQIEFWTGRMREWSSRRHPMLEWAAIWLRANAPRAQRVCITHGDYRIGNFLELDGRITAILDWELVHLGDPLEDLGWICLQAWRGRSPYMCHLLTREELREKYEALTNCAIERAALNYWEAFGTFKLAVMHLGASHCYETRGFNDLRMAGMGAQLPRLLLQVEASLERAS